MATATHIPVSEYLATSYRPDRDYIDGEVRERNLGEQPHALIQITLAAILHNHRKKWQIRVLPEQRVQVSKTRYRIPDVCVLAASASAEGIVREAPMICIEVLSPGDTIGSIQERADDYTEMGVPFIWAIDPLRRRAWVMSSDGLMKVREAELTVPGTPIRINLAEVFAELDEIQPPNKAAEI
jgi:Uma2 family endonuclease